MTGSAKQSMERQRKDGLLRRFAPKKKQTDKLLILFNVMDEPPPSVLFHPRGSAKGRCGTRNDGRHAFTPPPRHAPEALFSSSAQGGRGERRVPNAPAASCALGIGRTHTSNNEHTGITRHSRTQWF